jgi:hypothetical protein
MVCCKISSLVHHLIPPGFSRTDGQSPNLSPAQILFSTSLPLAIISSLSLLCKHTRWVPPPLPLPCSQRDWQTCLPVYRNFCTRVLSLPIDHIPLAINSLTLNIAAHLHTSDYHGILHSCRAVRTCWWPPCALLAALRSSSTFLLCTPTAHRIPPPPRYDIWLLHRPQPTRTIRRTNLTVVHARPHPARLPLALPVQAQPFRQFLACCCHPAFAFALNVSIPPSRPCHVLS